MIRRRPGLSHAVSSKRDGGDGKGKKGLTTTYDFKRERDNSFVFIRIFSLICSLV
jgi:hypothetical protein